MATTSAYAMAAGGEAAARPCRGTLLRARPSPPRLAFLSRTPARGASISLPTGLHQAAAAAEGRTGTGVGSEEVEEGPAWVELEPIGSDEQLDRALAAAQQRGTPIVLLWTASWCRKCIYLKPKLEKLAAEYYPRILFYCVDVNAVPQKLVNRAGVTVSLDMHFIELFFSKPCCALNWFFSSCLSLIDSDEYDNLLLMPRCAFLLEDNPKTFSILILFLELLEPLSCSPFPGLEEAISSTAPGSSALSCRLPATHTKMFLSPMPLSFCFGNREP
ncbi:hypothetical protein ACQ4PT_048640 [Festuca glaucescens]